MIISRVEELAKKKNVTMAQVAVAWHLHKEGEYQYPPFHSFQRSLSLLLLGVTAPIVGVNSIERLDDLLGMYR